jgi:hypothetical protein
MKNSVTENLTFLMKRQTELMNSYSEDEKQVLSALKNKDWPALSTALAAMEDKTRILASVEENRHQAYLALKKDLGYSDDQSFYQVISNFEPEQREEWGNLYRELKFSVLKMQNISFSINSYVYSVTGFLKEMVSMLYPHTRGKIYSREGNTRGAAAMPLIIDRSL